MRYVWLVVIAVALAGCQQERRHREAVPRPAAPPAPTTAQPKPIAEACIEIDARAVPAALRRLMHVAPPAGEVAGKAPRELQVVPVGQRTLLRGFAGGTGTVLLHLADGVSSGTPSEVGTWLSMRADRRIAITPPSEARGSVLRLFGERADGSAVDKLVGFGAEAVELYERYRTVYLPARPQDRRLELSALRLVDMDGDGGLELVMLGTSFAVDREGVIEGSQHAELGVVWPDGRVAIGQLSLGEFSIYPGVYLVPAAASGGRPMVLTRFFCCAAGEYRLYEIGPDELREVQNLGADDNMSKKVCLVPSSTGRARLLERSK